MNIIVVGANGQVGKSLIQLLTLQNYSFQAFTKSELDVTHQKQVDSLKKNNPSIIINASAYTSVDLAEEKQSLAFEVNHKAICHLIKLTQQLNIPLIHFSTDYVFNGTNQTPYHEQDTTCPLGVYGTSKLAGESAITSQLNKYIIIRTAWVFSEFGNNFLKTMLKLKDKENLSIVNDQIGQPTYAGDIAQATLSIIEHINSPNFKDWGIYHYSGDKAVSWFGFAQYIFKNYQQLYPNASIPQLKEITTHEFPTKAKRPAFSCLNNQKINQLLQIPSSNWQQAIKKCILNFSVNMSI